MTPDEEKDLLELEAQIIRLKMLNNQYARHLRRNNPSRGWLARLPLSSLAGEVHPNTWKALLTPNTWQNKMLMVVLTTAWAVFKRKRR